MMQRDRNNEARRGILNAVRGQLAASALLDAQRDRNRATRGLRQTADQAEPITAEPIGKGAEARLARFQQALESVGGQSVVVHSEQEAAEAIEKVIRSVHARRVALSDAAVVQKLIARVKADVEWREATASKAALLECDMGITSPQWGIAETGTLVLESERERHRLISLLPPVHLAVIEAEQICATMSEALALVKVRSATDLDRTITFITGPSRTADIELTLTIGVHGPQELHVIVSAPAQIK